MGLAGKGWPAPFDTDLDARRGLAFELVDGIALLSKVDWRAKGLADLGRPDGFHERQVDRWTAFLERIKGRELPGFDEASAWLRAHKPLDFVPGIMHGDYQFANVMYHDGAPARLAAIVDWEMGTVGDPEARPGLGRARLARGHERPGRRLLRLRRHDRHAVARRDPRPLRRGLGPPGRRHRLLRRARQVEARGGAGAGLPAGRRRREAAGVRARSSCSSCRRPPRRPSRRSTARERRRRRNDRGRRARRRAARRHPGAAPEPARRPQRARRPR